MDLFAHNLFLSGRQSKICDDKLFAVKFGVSFATLNIYALTVEELFAALQYVKKMFLVWLIAPHTCRQTASRT